MNYKALYNYVRDISSNLGITNQFFHGRGETLPLNELRKPLCIYSLPFRSTGSFTNQAYPLNETWIVEILFYMQDQADSAIDQNDPDVLQAEMEILSTAENAASKFLHYFNENMLSDELSDSADKLTILSFSKTPAIKDTGLLTGFVLSMNVTVPDDFNYCC